MLCILSLTPLDAFTAFSDRMVSSSLIQAICSSMGFAYVMKYTKCDMHLVHVLSKVLTRLGFFLIPATVIVTYFINIAIPSAAAVFKEYPYFMSEEFSLVDCYLAPLLWRLPVLGVDLSGAGAKDVQIYMQRVFERDSFLASLTEAEREMRLPSRG